MKREESLSLSRRFVFVFFSLRFCFAGEGGGLHVFVLFFSCLRSQKRKLLRFLSFVFRLSRVSWVGLPLYLFDHIWYREVACLLSSLFVTFFRLFGSFAKLRLFGKKKKNSFL